MNNYVRRSFFENGNDDRIFKIGMYNSIGDRRREYSV